MGPGFPAYRFSRTRPGTVAPQVWFRLKTQSNERLPDRGSSASEPEADACLCQAEDKEHTMVDEIAARATELLGQAEPVSRQPRKETLMSFREGHLFMALKLVSCSDRRSLCRGSRGRRP